MARILIVDDQEVARKSLDFALKAAGHETVMAQDGGEALRHQKQRPADLVILDLFMPEKEGLETIAEMRKKFPQLPIIAVSGGQRISGAMLEVARRLGAVDVFGKPFDPKELLEAIDRALAADGNK